MLEHPGLRYVEGVERTEPCPKCGKQWIVELCRGRDYWLLCDNCQWTMDIREAGDPVPEEV